MMLIRTESDSSTKFIPGTTISAREETARLTKIYGTINLIQIAGNSFTPVAHRKQILVYQLLLAMLLSAIQPEFSHFLA